MRERLVELLIKYREGKGHDIIVVFDGWKSGGNTEASTVRGGVRIIYSRLGEKADSVIKRIVSSERHEWLVVSSDREIASHAWSAGSIPIGSGAFLQIIEKEYAQGDDRLALEEDEQEMNTHRKGNPRQLSKKEKMLKRALSKL